MSPELGNALSSGCVNVRQQARKKCDAAERYEDPTDDGDWAGRLFMASEYC